MRRKWWRKDTKRKLESDGPLTPLEFAQSLDLSVGQLQRALNCSKNEATKILNLEKLPSKSQIMKIKEYLDEIH